MSEQSDGGVAHCPNCGAPSIDSYDTGNEEVIEWDCHNPGCRCRVFESGDSQ